MKIRYSFDTNFLIIAHTRTCIRLYFEKNMYVYLEIFGLQYLNCAFTALNTFVANVYTRIFIFLRDCLIGWRFEKLYPHNSLVITLDGFISCRFFCLYPEFFGQFRKLCQFRLIIHSKFLDHLLMICNMIFYNLLNIVYIKD